MTMRVSCRIGHTRANLPFPGVSNASLKTAIENAFRRASYRGTSRPPNVKIHVTAEYRSRALLPENAGSTTANLLRSLRNLIGNQTSNGPAKIGLLLADRFVGRPFTFGYMIDGDIHQSSNPAREGCVVFLHPLIQARRQGQTRAQAAAIRREYVFTCIHELGHTFNLWHRQVQPNYMASSGPTAYPMTAHRFVTDHRDYLKIDHNNWTKFVIPAGSAWGARPPGFPTDNDPENLPRTAKKRRGTLELTIGMTPRAFFYFEPVELDIRLTSRSRRAARVPDCIDPGYDAFDIWIERPGGERFRYCPIKRFMETPGMLDIRFRKPFKRDLSIFAQRGGYTFHESGTYKIWAELRHSTQTLISNKIEIQVFESNERLKSFRILRDASERNRIADLLYFREARLAKADSEAISYIGETLSSSHYCASLDYAMARNRAGRLLCQTRPRMTSVRSAMEELDRCANHSSLSSHRSYNALAIAKDLEDRYLS